MNWVAIGFSGCALCAGLSIGNFFVEDEVNNNVALGTLTYIWFSISFIGMCAFGHLAGIGADWF